MGLNTIREARGKESSYKATGRYASIVVCNTQYEICVVVNNINGKVDNGPDIIGRLTDRFISVIYRYSKQYRGPREPC